MKALRSQFVTSNNKKTGSKVLSMNIIKTDGYKRFIQDIKHGIQSVQIKAAVVGKAR